MRQLIRLVVCTCLLLAGVRPAMAQSRIAILDATAVSVLDTTTGAVRARFPLQLGPQEKALAIAATPDGARLLVTAKVQAPPFPGLLYVLDASTGEQLARISIPGSHNKAAVLPDGTRAFLTTSGGPTASKLVVVDLASYTTLLYTSPALQGCAPPATSLTMRPDGATLHMICKLANEPVKQIDIPVPPVGATSALLTAQAPVERLVPGFEAQDLSFSPDGSTKFVTFSRNGANPTILVDCPGACVEYRLDVPFEVVSIGTIRAQSTSRVFVEFRSGQVFLFDTIAAAFLGSTSIAGTGTIVTDRTGAMTFALEPTRLSRLDNDTAAPTLVATGAGGWFDAEVLSDPPLQPLMTIDEPGAVAQQPFIVRGWAIERGGTPSTASPPPATVSAVHVWAWPADGGAPHFIGADTTMGPRPDVAAVYGSPYAAAEFSLPVQGLPSGTYTIVAYAQSARDGTFTQQQGVVVSVQPGTRITVDQPGATVPRNFAVSGWAADVSTTSGPGVDAVHVWAYPASGAAPIFAGVAACGGARDDVAAVLGPSFRNSGYWLFASLPPGSYTLVVFAHSTVTGEFNGYARALAVVPDSAPEMSLDEPGPASTIAGPFAVRGWTLDRGAASGTGIDAIHVWAFPIDGSTPRFAGVAAPTARPDVAAIFGPQFNDAGFLLTGVTLPPGTYDLVAYGHSTVTQSFSVSRGARVTVQ